MDNTKEIENENLGISVEKLFYPGQDNYEFYMQQLSEKLSQFKENAQEKNKIIQEERVRGFTEFLIHLKQL